MKLDFMYDDFDLKITNGDFVIDRADEQHAFIIINSTKGEIRQYPELGVGINLYQGSNLSDQEIISIIETELKKDDIILLEAELERKNGYIYNIKVNV